MNNINTIPNGFEGSMLEGYSCILTPKDVAKILRIGNNSVYELLNSGAIPNFRIGRKHKVRKIDLINYINNQINKPINL